MSEREYKKNENACGNKFCKEIRIPGSKDDGWKKKRIRGNYLLLCTKCNMAYNDKQYCEYCKQVYWDPSNPPLDGDEWIQCEICKRWTHVSCEAKEGCKEIKSLKIDPHFEFACSECKRLKSFVKKNTKKENSRSQKSNNNSKILENSNCRRSNRQRKRPLNNSSADFLFYESNVCNTNLLKNY